MTKEEYVRDGSWILKVFLDRCETQAETDYLNYLIEVLEQEPCEDCISRTQAIKAMDELENEDIEAYGCSIPEGFDGKRARKAICLLPSIQPKPKTGHWIWQKEDIYRCSECGNDIRVKEVMHEPQYVCCPICETKMQAESEDKE